MSSDKLPSLAPLQYPRQAPFKIPGGINAVSELLTRKSSFLERADKFLSLPSRVVALKSYWTATEVLGKLNKGFCLPCTEVELGCACKLPQHWGEPALI